MKLAIYTCWTVIYCYLFIKCSLSLRLLINEIWCKHDYTMVLIGVHKSQLN